MLLERFTLFYCRVNNTSTANSGWAGPYTFTLDSAAMADFSISTADNVTFDFDASQSVKATGYHWDFGDGNTGSGAITSHTYTQGGGFTVILSITSDCEPDTTSQTLASAVDVGKWEIAKIKAYPNPTKGIIVIENLHPSIQGSELLVYSAMGVMVKKFVIGDVSTQTFDLGDLPSGVYNLRISNSSGAWNIAQIVVQ